MSITPFLSAIYAVYGKLRFFFMHFGGFINHQAFSCFSFRYDVSAM